MLDTLLRSKPHDGAERGLDSLLPQNPLSKISKYYLISCQVEGKSPRTIQTYKMAISELLSSLDSARPDANKIRLFLLSLQDRGLSPVSIHVYYRSLKTFFNWLIREGHLSKNPMCNINPPRLDIKVIRPFTSEDINRLLLVTSGTRFIDYRNRAIVLVFLDTGMRKEEMAGLRLQDIDFESGMVRVFGKGRKERYVRVGKTTRKALLNYLAKRDDELSCLWLTEERCPITAYGISSMVRRLCRWAEITGVKIGPHTFRHTAAINYLRNGGSEFTLQIMLGHTSLDMTRRYVLALGAEDMARVHEKASPVDNLGIK